MQLLGKPFQELQDNNLLLKCTLKKGYLILREQGQWPER